MAESARTFLKRFLGFSIGPLVSSVIGFFTVPITTWFIMPDEFGKASMYALASTFLAMVIFMGMDQAFAREFHARTDKKTLYFNAVLIPLSLSIIAGFFILIFYKPFSMLLYASVQLDAMIMLAVSLPVSVFYRFNLLLIRMQERARLYSLLNILDRVLGFTFLMLFIFLYEKSFKSIVLANFCSYISISAINVALTSDYFKKGVHIDKALLKVLVKFGLPLIPTSLLAWVFESMDRIAMRQWSDFTQIGLYSGAFKIVTVLQLFSSAFNTFWAPTVYRWYETNVEKDLFHKVSTVLFGMMSICFAFIVLFRNIIIMLLSKSYAGSAVLVPFLIYIPIMYTTSETTGMGIGFTRKTSYSIIVSGVSAGINFIGNYLLVPKYGALGACISTAVSYMVFFWVKTMISRKLWWKFNLKAYIVNSAFMGVYSFLTLFTNNFFLELPLALMILVYNYPSIKYLWAVAFNKKLRRQE